MKKGYETMNAIKYGEEVGFWEWYYRGKFKENVAFFSNNKKDWIEELKKHYNRLSNSRENSLKNIKHERWIISHSAKCLLAQLKSIEIIFNEFNVVYKI